MNYLHVINCLTKKWRYCKLILRLSRKINFFSGLGNFGKISLTVIAFLLFVTNVYAKDYVIGDGDTLRISVWGNAELSIDATVRPDGKISIPAVGEIKASGLTSLELTDILKREIEKMVKKPIITVIVTGMRNYRIFVFGRGTSAGVHTLVRETSVLEFLSQLGSLSNADLENSYLVRDRKKIKVNFFELYEKGDFSQDIVLQPNDMLFIPDIFEKRISIVGAVETPTSISYREGLTILDIILSSGGFTEFANKNNVEILRNNSKSERTRIPVRAKDLMKGDLSKNIKIMPGDVIVVKESLF
ncbi:MAG: polysaccharide biosynthesis/export family protein [Nitrospirota bacterium]